jgi:hypothetical protein
MFISPARSKKPVDHIILKFAVFNSHFSIFKSRCSRTLGTLPGLAARLRYGGVLIDGGDRRATRFLFVIGD